MKPVSVSFTLAFQTGPTKVRRLKVSPCLICTGPYLCARCLAAGKCLARGAHRSWDSPLCGIA